MSKVLHHVAKKERFNLPDSASQSIIEASDGNLRKALLVLEAMRMQKPDLSGDIEVARPDWELYCSKVADAILHQQTPQQLLEVRGKIYELLSHCIPPAVVLKVSIDTNPSHQTIADRIVDKVDDVLKPQIVHWAAHYVSRVLEI